MKRPNPRTGLPFVRGEVRPEDGAVFHAYQYVRRADGTYRESWLRPAAFDRQTERMRSYARVRAGKRSG